MQILIALLLTVVLIVCGCVYFAETHGVRNKRFLIYPEGNSRVQVSKIFITKALLSLDTKFLE